MDAVGWVKGWINAYKSCIYLQKNAFGRPLVTMFVHKPFGANVDLLVKEVSDRPDLDNNN